MNAKPGQNCLDKNVIQEVLFQDIFLVPLKNGLTRPKKVRGQGTKMVGMCEVFAHDRIGKIDMERVPLGVKETDFLLAPKDLLFARQSLVLSGAGKCSIFLDITEPVTFESHLIRARLNQDISDPMFYYYYFKSKLGRQKIEAITEQVAAAGIRSSDLAKITVPLPLKSMQQSIAGYCSSLDELIEINNRMNETLEALAYAFFKSWFIDFDPVQAKVEGKEPFGMDEKTAALFPQEFEDTDLGEVPKGWGIQPIKEFCTTWLGGTPDTANDDYWVNGEIKWINSGELNSSRIVKESKLITKKALDNSATKLMPPRTVLVAITGATMGKVSLLEVEACGNQSIVGIKSNNFLGQDYIYYYLKEWMHRLVSNATGSAHQHINKNDVNDFRVLIPPEALCNEYSRIVLPLFDMQRNNLLNNETLSKVRDTLLPILLSGELRVSDDQVNNLQAKVDASASTK